METKWFLTTIFLLISIILLTLLLTPHSVCYIDRCFKIEIANNPKERELGLMFRESLDADQGMLFIHPKDGNYPFWMKNTLIPLDIIWIDKDQRVVFIQKDAKPCSDQCLSIDPKVNSKYVLEVNSDLTEEIELAVGDKLRFKGITISNLLVK